MIHPVGKVRSGAAVTIVSGIAPTVRGGTGRLLRSLIQERDSKGLDARFVLVGNRANVARSMVLRRPLAVASEAVRHYARRLSRSWLIRQRTFIDSPRLIVIHPQEIGVRWLDRVIQRRWRNGLRTEILVLDASFFCVRSYNHLPAADGPCRRCLDEGPVAGRQLGCRPFPIHDGWAFSFVERLRERAALGQVVFWTQTSGYQSLLRDYAGPGVDTRLAGLWTDDFDDFDVECPAVAPLADVVFHGVWLEAKGAAWTLRLAAALPERTFLFPCRPPGGLGVPANVTFRPLSWDTGLAAQVRASPLCLVPSLWTAPIEAALVKSIAHAPATAVRAVSHGFAASLPSNLVIRLPEEPSAAAETIRRHASWRLDPAVRAAWIQDFTIRNRGLLQRLCETSVA